MNQSEFLHLDLKQEGPLGILALNRPEKLNALSLQVLHELTVAVNWFDARPEIRCVVVQGNGASFCAGADLDGFPTLQEQSLRQAADAGRIMAEAITGMNSITIASIHGWCVGGGLVLAAACDMRVASDTARFSIPEVDLGIPLAWGGVPRLVRELGPAVTKELVITCREFHAQEAHQMGFLNRVVSEADRLDATRQLAGEVASRPAMPVSVTKRHVNAVVEQSGSTQNAWSDADGLIAGLLDPDCQSAREAYLRSKLQK